MAGPLGVSCEYCDAPAIVVVNGYPGCADHIDQAMHEGLAPVKEAIRRLGGALTVSYEPPGTLYGPGDTDGPLPGQQFLGSVRADEISEGYEDPTWR